MSYNLSALFERVVDTVPEREALVTPARRLTYAGLEQRANRCAHALAGLGIGPGDHVGLQLLNGTEYVEAMLGAFKLRAVPVNVNYRYVERELAYLYDNADLKALVCHEQFLPVARAAWRSAPVASVLVVADGSAPGGGQDLGAGADVLDYEQALATAGPERDFRGRSGDDLYLAYTGGTTGMPKGVMWRHEDVFFAALGGGDPLLDKGPISDPDELPGRVAAFPLSQLCTPPLMHVSAHWGAFNVWYGGGKVALLAPGAFDPVEGWNTVEREGINVITVVGDAMARPLLDALEAAPETGTGTLLVFSSGGAVLSASTKEQIKALLPNVIIIDAFGSSETGVAGSTSNADPAAGSSRFNVDEHTTVLDDDLRPVTPGSGQVGRFARRGHVPLGYYKDPSKSAATFVEIDGERWVLPGDLGTVEDDGTVILLGRDSACINTGGEKVYAEEVETVLKGHPDVYDALVVGVPDDRWGQRVAAVVEPRPGATPDLDAVRDEARRHLAGYKVPRQLHLVTKVQRAPNGKPDYAWARSVACDQATGAPSSKAAPAR